MAIEFKVVAPDRLATIHRDTQQAATRGRVTIGPGHPDYAEVVRLESRIGELGASIKKNISALRTAPNP